MIVDYLTRETPLNIEIELVDGSTIKTVGDAETYFRNLNAEQHQKSHWDTAVRMFAIAMREPAYLRGATLSLENALALDRLIVRIQNGYLQA